MTTRAKSFLTAAVGFALLGSSEMVLAAPFMNFSILGSKDPAAPLSSWTSNLSVGVGETVYVVVVGKMADLSGGPIHNVASTFFPDMTGLTSGDTGLKTVKFSLIQDAPDTVASKNLLQADFQAFPTAFTNGKTDPVWGTTSVVAGVVTPRAGGTGSDLLDIYANRLGGSPLFAGVDAAGGVGASTYVVMEKFVVGGTAAGTSTIKGKFNWVSTSSGAQSFQYKKGSNASQSKAVITDWANPNATYAADPIATWSFLTLTPSGGPVEDVSYAALSTSTVGRHSTAAILGGKGPAPAPVAANWIWAATSPVAPTHPPFASPAPSLVSDIVTIDGTGTVPILLQMSFDPGAWQNGGPAASADQGHIQLALLDSTGAAPSWVLAEAPQGPMVAGPAPVYAGAIPVGDVGIWGVDVQNHVVWQVVNQSGTYAVVPEPATLGLLGLAALGLTIRRRRQNA